MLDVCFACLQAVPSDLDGLFGHWSHIHDGNSLVGAKDRLSYGVDPDSGEVSIASFLFFSFFFCCCDALRNLGLPW